MTTKYMTAVETMKVLLEGKKVMGDWVSDHYIHVVDDKVVNDRGEPQGSLKLKDNYYKLWQNPNEVHYSTIPILHQFISNGRKYMKLANPANVVDMETGALKCFVSSLNFTVEKLPQ